VSRLPTLGGGQIDEELIIEPHRDIEYTSNPTRHVCKNVLGLLNIETVNCHNVDGNTWDFAEILDDLLTNKTTGFEWLEVKLS
jgi:hypothetical protein